MLVGARVPRARPASRIWSDSRTSRAESPPLPCLRFQCVIKSHPLPEPSSARTSSPRQSNMVGAKGAKAVKILCGLCVASAFLALKHTRTPLFNAKVAKNSDAKSAKALCALCVPSAFFTFNLTVAAEAARRRLQPLFAGVLARRCLHRLGETRLRRDVRRRRRHAAQEGQTLMGSDPIDAVRMGGYAVEMTIAPLATAVDT